MAVYSKLLLSAGGGIVSANQQAEQDKKNATVLIGLGGTGIDAIRTIKTQVYSRLKPDDPDAVAPTYDHIRFLGIDTAEGSKGDAEENEDQKADSLMALDDTEAFSISNPNLRRAFENPQAIQMRDELSWLRWEQIKAPDLGTAGAGGIRQVGRFMMMDKSQEFMSRVEQEINAAKRNLTAPNVYVHIFSGLSGGTGAGSFLDVCYMVKHVAKRLGGVTVCGYFFLPDVNLSKIPMSATQVRQYIPVNGYAAMQELDYCMQLQSNGGGFTQTYKNHVQVEWKEAPVDMCHLVCATNSNGDIRANAYDYAMNVTAEYVMNFLAKPDAKFDLSQHMSNFTQMVGTADTTKIIGSNLAYIVIGAACASIPLREINTYLATELFTQFAQICQNVPTKADVEQLAVNALANGANSLSAIYDSLYREVMADVSTDYASFPGDWKEVRDMGNADMVRNYTDQKASKLNVVVKNGKSMKTEGNNQSLISRIRAQLDALVRNISFGPMFAYKLVSAAESHNLLNIIDGLIQENTSRKNQEAAQHTLRYGDYENAKSDFESRRSRGLFDNDQKRFGDYEYYLMLAMQHELYMEVYRQLEDVLATLRTQLEEAVANYYIKLNRVMNTLVESFESNRAALADEKILQGTGSFSIPMMTIDELKKSLNAEIERVNIPNMLDAFMRLLQNNEETWITEDEKKIVKLVNDFFVKTAFAGFADRTITSFLKDKYKLDGDAELAERIYKDWMQTLTAQAKPLFYFNPSIWSEAQTSKLAFLSFPEESAPIKAAAAKMNATDPTWGANGSSLTDRIFVMCSACALPLSAYNNCTEYERQCFSTVGVGRHYYEGKDVPGMYFNDWRKLPSLTPQSLLNLNTAPDIMKELVGDARALYEEGRKFNLFTDDNVICQPDPASIEQLQALIAKVPTVVEKLNKPAVPKAKEFIAQIEAARNIASVPTTDAMPDDGYAKDKEKKLSVQKDHFVASPAFQMKVEERLKTLREVDAAAQAAIDALNAKLESLTDNQTPDFLNAVFTGIITVKGVTVSYEDPEDIFGDPVILSKMGGEFPFGAIPLYQGLVSYKAMDEDTKKNIVKLANDRMNEGAPEIADTCTALKAIFSVPKLKGWVEMAKQFTECNDIIAFLKTLQEQFKSFCLINGIE